MRRVRDNSQYRSRIRRNDVMDGVRNVLGDNILWPPEITVPPALITAEGTVSKIEETPVSKAPDSLSVSPSLLTVSVATLVE